MKKETESRSNYFISKIEASLESKTSISRIRNRLEAYPNMKLVGDGTCLRYVIDEAPDRFYTMEIDRTYLSITIHSRTTPLYFLSEALIKFLTVAQTLKDCCRISIEGLYPYLMLVLANQQIAGAMAIGAGCSSNVPGENSDTVLSRRILSLLNENNKLKLEHIGELRESRMLLQKLIAFECVEGASVESIANSVGLSRTEIVDALSCMCEIGYKVIHMDRDRFSLVRV